MHLTSIQNDTSSIDTPSQAQVPVQALSCTQVVDTER